MIRNRIQEIEAELARKMSDWITTFSVLLLTCIFISYEILKKLAWQTFFFLNRQNHGRTTKRILSSVQHLLLSQLEERRTRAIILTQPVSKFHF